MEVWAHHENEAEEHAMDLKSKTECGHPPTRSDQPEPLLKIQQVAEWLSVSLSTLYHSSSTGDGPPKLKIGGGLRYKRCCVRAWIDEQSSDPGE